MEALRTISPGASTSAGMVTSTPISRSVLLNNHLLSSALKRIPSNMERVVFEETAFWAVDSAIIRFSFKQLNFIKLAPF
jgi:hypothetical protein